MGHDEKLDQVLGDSIKLVFTAWKGLLGLGLPISLAGSVATYLAVEINWGIDPSWASTAVELAIIAAFSALWVVLLEEKLEVLRFPKPLGVRFLWALAGVLVIYVIAAALFLVAGKLLSEGMQSSVSNLGWLIIHKASSALVFAVTGPLTAGWILVGSNMRAFGAIGKSLRRLFHFVLISIIVTVVSSIAGGVAGAIIGAALGLFGIFGAWGLGVIQFLGTLFFYAFALSFSLIVFHRLYPEFLREPHAG